MTVFRWDVSPSRVVSIELWSPGNAGGWRSWFLHKHTYGNQEHSWCFDVVVLGMVFGLNWSKKPYKQSVEDRAREAVETLEELGYGVRYDNQQQDSGIEWRGESISTGNSRREATSAELEFDGDSTF